MASASDPIYVLVSTHTQSPDGSTRNDAYYMTATLNAYAAQLANNIATPVYNAYLNELVAGGQVMQVSSFQATPIPLPLSAGGPVQLRCEIGIGFQPLATPLRYHLVVHDVFATPTNVTTKNGQWVYDWIDSQLKRLTPVNLYQGVYFV